MKRAQEDNLDHDTAPSSEAPFLSADSGDIGKELSIGNHITEGAESCTTGYAQSESSDPGSKPSTDETVSVIAFDCETSDWSDAAGGCPSRATIGRVVQLAWVTYSERSDILREECHILRPHGYTIAKKAENFHRITNARALAEGRDGMQVMREFVNEVIGAGNGVILVGHHIQHDVVAVLNEPEKREMLDLEFERRMSVGLVRCDTMDPRLLHAFDFDEFGLRKRGMSLTRTFQVFCGVYEEAEGLINGAHDALHDALMTGGIYSEAKMLGILNRPRVSLIKATTV
ncbi:hypothetical protein BC830DRAFT_1080651 [Chytriomyces sp. MP71]|nr:hypothetical protein BC830DRAFT_1080651 [Chytriomyces sp. MP71]